MRDDWEKMRLHYDPRKPKILRSGNAPIDSSRKPKNQRAKIETFMKKILLSALLSCSVLSAHAALFQYSISFSDVGEANPSPGASGFGTGPFCSDATTCAHRWR